MTTFALDVRRITALADSMCRGRVKRWAGAKFRAFNPNAGRTSAKA